MFNYTTKPEDECEFIEVADKDDFGNGDRVFLEIDDASIVLFKIADSYFAIADLCSHDEGPLGDGDFDEPFEIVCPRHGARFDVRSGKAITGPAYVDIPAYPVRVDGNKITIGIPK